MAIVAVAGAVLAWLNAWRALVFVAPTSCRVTVEDPGPLTTVPGALEATHAQLLELGFESLGSHTEQHPLGPARWHLDYVHRAEGVWASVHAPPKWGLSAAARCWVPRAEAEGPRARVSLVTPGTQGVLVSSNFRRPGAHVPGAFFCGAIEGVPLARLLRAHVRRVPEVGAPQGEWTVDGLAALLRGCFNGAGKTELRQRHAAGLLWTLGALGMVGVSLFLQPNGPIP
ncbi:MAG: hypothetical protein JNG84_07940 [Archangium sp.]|nr:hypothetical protein [Archangium sp.]